MKLSKLYKDFFRSEKTGGLVLLIVTAISFTLANTGWQSGYFGFWHHNLGNHSITHWINDGLMTVFFLLIGLELKREVVHGELSKVKKALLPIFGAVGGMIVPAMIYLSLNIGTQTQSGAGIPMATDIAFAIGILSLLGKRVPASLKIFLTALAVIDDLGAILVIALFYSTTISFLNLILALTVFVLLLMLNKLKVNNIIPYLIGGFFMWYFMLNSGVHATITGVLLAFAIPLGKGEADSPSSVLQHFLHRPVALLILPLFAMANTAIPIGGDWKEGLRLTSSMGIMAGLVIGKPLGIWLFTIVSAGLGLCALPKDLKWKNIFGAGLLGGIGFTMSIFITLLAFDNETIINHSKFAIIMSSLIAGTIGYLLLNATLEGKPQKAEKPKSGKK